MESKLDLSFPFIVIEWLRKGTLFLSIAVGFLTAMKLTSISYYFYNSVDL